MATIEERKSRDGAVAYRAKVRLKGHPLQTATFKRKTDAKKWAQQTEAAIAEGRYFKAVEAKKHTVAELIDRYLHDVLPAKKSAKDQKRHLIWWRDQIGYITLADVTPALITEQRDRLKTGATYRGAARSSSTVNRYLAALSHVFTVGMREWGWLEDNPFRKIPTLKEPRGRVRFLSDDEFDEAGNVVKQGERTRLLAACKTHSDQFYTIVVLALSTGARQGEILNLRWRDVDLQRGIIILEETKNSERRAIPLQGHALELVREMSKLRRINTDLLFPSKKDPRQPLAIQHIWQKALKTANIQDFRFHDLRHSAASYLAMSGASIAEIAEVLGHKTLQMVKRYAHLSEPHAAGVVARMNKQIFGG